MSDTRRLLKCARCMKEFPFDGVRFTPDGRSVVCKKCLGVVEYERKELDRAGERPYTFQCLECRHMFSRTLQSAPRTCPNCGATEFARFQKDRITSADMLKMADDPRLERMDRGGSWDR